MEVYYYFTVEQSSIGKGYVKADSEEEARMKISSGNYDDIYDEVGLEIGNIIEIWEGK